MGGGEEGEGMILKGGSEANAGEGSYRLKRRFEGGSHGEVGKEAIYRDGRALVVCFDRLCAKVGGCPYVDH